MVSEELLQVAVEGGDTAATVADHVATRLFPQQGIEQVLQGKKLVPSFGRFVNGKM
ncbi:hypothetical protein D3C83_113720 [compost metagenome]